MQEKVRQVTNHPHDAHGLPKTPETPASEPVLESEASPKGAEESAWFKVLNRAYSQKVGRAELFKRQ
jgi:hypothetical protein